VSAAESYLQLTRQIDVLRQHWRGRRVLAGVLCAGGCVLLGLFILTALDTLLKPGTFGRYAMALIFWSAALLSVIHFVARRWWENRRDDYFAVLIERQNGNLCNRLINAMQLGRGNDFGSSQLVDAIVGDAARATADLDFAESLDKRALKQSAVFGGIGALVVVLYAGLFTPWFANSLSRILLPASEIAPYTATQFVNNSIKPANARVPEGSTIAFEAKVDGVVPPNAELFRRNIEDGRWGTASMEADLKMPGTFRTALREVSESFDYYVRAGDGKSAVYRVDVVERPRIETISLKYDPPPYTKLEAQHVEGTDGALGGLADTAVSIRITASKPLGEATLVAAGPSETVINLTKDADADAWSGQLTLWSEAATGEPDGNAIRINAPSRYQIKLKDEEGIDNADPMWRSILLIGDQPPGVSIVAPGRDLHANPGDKVQVIVDAHDDYGLADVKLLFRVNDESAARELAHFTPQESAKQMRETFDWDLAETGLKPGDLAQYWAVAADQNNITGPGTAESRRFTIFIITPSVAVASFEIQMNDFVQVFDELVRIQRENRAQTASGIAFETLVTRQTLIRTTTSKLARAMEKAPTSLDTMVSALDQLLVGPMAQAIQLLEAGRDAQDAAVAAAKRNESLPVQDQIIAALVELLSRLQRNEQARDQLRKIAKTDAAAHKQIGDVLAKVMQDLGRMVGDEKGLQEKFEKLSKKPVDELNEESLEKIAALDELTGKWGEWAKGSVNELAKLPTGFVDDFGLRPELQRIFEEIEKVSKKPKTEKLHVAIEDLGASLATEMLEDLEMWMMDAPDTLQWLLEEPLTNKPLDIPEMPLPDVLQDMIGDLLEDANDIDQEAEDITSAWGDNLNQAGWGAMDGPISSFSAKGVTGNVLPNNIELSGRAGDGRRGKSSGQMVGATTRNLAGRRTPARVGSERYEPGVVREEQSQDPGGATGGGKKAGAGQRGLQGGTPPDFVKDMDRLRQLNVGLREQAMRVANRMEAAGVNTVRLDKSIESMQATENDLQDYRYEDAARRRRVALSELRGALNEVDQSVAVDVSRARELPPQLREELVQADDENYPEGYESLVKSYYRALSAEEKK
jgi:hypothetical protein